jgi:2'-5' RNA ligase
LSVQFLHSFEAAIDVLIPEVEPLVSTFRDKYDPSTAKGMPAHITINYPFLPGLNPDTNLYREFTKLFAGINSFSINFNKFDQFPGVVYLAPEPEAPFKELIEKVAAHFPESLPYSGAFDKVVPHLTVAHAEDEALMASIQNQLAEQAQ